MLTLTFARDHPAPFRPLRAAPPLSTWSRRVGLTLRLRSRPCGLLRPAGEDASKNQRLQPTYMTSTPWTVRFSNHPLHQLWPVKRASMAPHPAETLAGGHDRVEPRLTASLQLRQRSQMASEVPPRGVQHRSFLMSPWPRSLRRRSLNTPALSAGDEGPDRASDALCRANLPRGVSPASSWYQG